VLGNHIRCFLVAILFAEVLPIGMSAQSSRVRVYDFPAGIGAPSEIGICSEDGPVLFWSKDSSQPNSSTLYRFDLCTQNLGALLKGTLGDIRCSPPPHILSVQLRNGDATTLVVLDDNGKETGELKYPESAAYFFPQWTTDGSRLVYEVDDPNKAPNDTLAFTAFGVLDVSACTHSIFPIHQNAFGLGLVTRTDKTLICISWNDAEAPAAWRFAIRDLNGERMQLPEDETQELCKTQNHRYYASRQIELSQSFQIFSSQTRKVVASFSAVDRKTNEPLVAGRWSPTNDNLLVIGHRSNNNELQSIVVLNVADLKVINRIKTNVYSWTPNGEAIVYFQEHKLVFMRVVG
jgi:hypothetical protein